MAMPTVHASVLSLQPSEAKQGQTVEVLLSDSSEPTCAADNSSVEGPTIAFRNHRYRTFAYKQADPEARTYRALICVPADLDPGRYKISCGADEQVLKVVSAGFAVQKISLPKAKDNFEGSPGEKAAVDSAKQTVTDSQLWQGAFKRPCKARISAQFGLRRSVNGRLLKDYFHSGIDYAGGMGAPVYATQSGTVLLAHSGWKLHGNTICINHGQGIQSFYLHLSKIFVKEGQKIKAGEKIGAVGSTGRANGPHLHFSIYVNNEAGNPSYWFNKGF